MNQDLVAPLAGVVIVGGALTLVVVALGVALLRARGTASRERETARAEVAALRARVEEIERRLATSGAQRTAERPGEREFVITQVGDGVAGPRHAGAGDPGEDPGDPAGRPEPALFADIVLRESVVRVASLAHGVRVALAPEARHRIRFEVRREVRRARKQRRTETKLARREHASRQRATLTDGEDAA